MTAKEKAKELVGKCKVTAWDEKSAEFWHNKKESKRYALICVDEQIKSSDWYAEMKMLVNWGNTRKYWQEVKQEINKI